MLYFNKPTYKVSIPPFSIKKMEIHNYISYDLHLCTILPKLCVRCYTESNFITKYCKLRIDIKCHFGCQVLVTINKHV